MSSFPARSNSKQYKDNINVTAKTVTTIANLDSSKAYGPDFIPLLVLKTYEPQLSSILVKLFNMCLRKSSFLVLQFFYYAFMFFLTMLPKILFLILIVLFSILCVIGLLFYGNS